MMSTTQKSSINHHQLLEALNKQKKNIIIKTTLVRALSQGHQLTVSFISYDSVGSLASKA